MLGSWLLLVSCAFGVGPGLNAPLFAQASDQTDRVAMGWFLAGSKPEYYRTGVDPISTINGRPTTFLRNSLPDTNGYGTVMQIVDAKIYAGKRLRLRASLRSQNVGDWAGLWMRVDKRNTTVAFDNMHSRAIRGTQPWNSYDVVLDVPADATTISFGVLLSGPGQMEMNQATIEPVAAETKVTGTSMNLPSKTPVSPDFSN
jgi:hypothetical protein